MSIMIPLVVLCTLILVNAFYVAAEFALISSPRVQLEQLSSTQPWARRMLDNLTNTARQDHYIAVAQIGITISSLGLGMYSEHAFAELFKSWIDALKLEFLLAYIDGLATVVSLALLTYLHVVFGEMIPKSMAIVRPLPVARFVEAPMRVSGWVLAPLVWLLNTCGNLILKLFHLPVSKELSLVYSSEELSLVFEESKEGGLLEAEYSDWMQRLLTLPERVLREVMVARIRVVGLSKTTTIAQAIKEVGKERYSRYPIYEQNIDHVLGTVHIRDIFKAMRSGKGEEEIGTIMRDCPKFPESMHLNQAFEIMRCEQAHMACVVDEHGGIGGIVTLEDLLEEVFGEVRDEFDEAELSPIVQEADNLWLVSGAVVLSDLSEELDLIIKNENVETVSGLVMDVLGRLPKVGDSVQSQGLQFDVLAIADMVVERCRVTKLSEGEATEEDWPDYAN